ncbi:MAG: DnaB-like helicase C-terminal domain-containing protein [Chloroflexota bacterium]
MPSLNQPAPVAVSSVDTPAAFDNDLAAKLRRLLLEGDGRMRERNVSAAARGLKDVSGELGMPVLALVQLNRNRPTRSDKRRNWRPAGVG